MKHTLTQFYSKSNSFLHTRMKMSSPSRRPRFIDGIIQLLRELFSYFDFLLKPIKFKSSQPRQKMLRARNLLRHEVWDLVATKQNQEFHQEREVNNLHTEKKEDWKQRDMMRMAKNKKTNNLSATANKLYKYPRFFLNAVFCRQWFLSPCQRNFVLGETRAWMLKESKKR